jgi:hypothetical protein
MGERMFKIIDDIMKTKTGKSLDRSDFKEVFSLYMVQRWLTMHSDINVEILNMTVNILYKSLDDEQHFKLMSEILPVTPRRGKYIKVAKKDTKKKKKDDVDVSAFFEESSSKIDESLEFVYGTKEK